MGSFLTLAADFIENLSNPAKGPEVNEEYSLRMAQTMLEGDFKEILTREIGDIENINILSAYGWLWLIRWCRANNIKLPEKIATELLQRWSNVFLQSAVIDLMTFDQEPIDSTGNKDYKNDNFDNQWLEAIIKKATPPSEPEETKESANLDYKIPISAQSLLIAFLQSGTPAALAAAKQLLRTEWRGRDQLLRYFYLQTERLDQDIRSVWLEKIEPPEIL